MSTKPIILNQYWPLFCLLYATVWLTSYKQVFTFDSQVNEDLPVIEQAIYAAVNTQSEISCETDFQVGEIQQDGDWAFITLLCWPLEQTDPEVFVPTSVVLAIAQYDRSEWHVYLDGDEMYRQLLPSIPTSLLSTEAKTTLLQMSPSYEQSLNTPFTTGLPWQVGETWYYRTSIHGSNNALDLASPCGSVGQVRAADSGVVVYAYETCMLVQRSDGLAIGYQHLNTSDIANWNPGDAVSKGSFLGNTTMASGCDGDTYAHHVHFWLNNENPNGSTFGGWVLNDPYLVKNSQSRYPNLGCVNGSNDLYYESSCCGCALANTYNPQSGSLPQPNFIDQFGTPEGPLYTPLPSISPPDALLPPTPIEDEPQISWENDNNPPTGVLQVRGGSTTPSLNVVLTLNINQDDGSPMQQMRFSADNVTWTEWETFQPSRAWQLENVNTPQPVYAQVQDAAGNVSAVMETIVTAVLNTPPPSSASYTIGCSVMGMGGGTISSGSYTVHHTVGQGYETADLQSSSYRVLSGFESECTNITGQRMIYLPIVVRP